MVEADLNPVRCTSEGCVVLDMRVRIERRRPSQARQDVVTRVVTPASTRAVLSEIPQPSRVRSEGGATLTVPQGAGPNFDRTR